jgi:transcriptional regulator with XRE-family HTH domain
MDKVSESPSPPTVAKQLSSWEREIAKRVGRTVRAQRELRRIQREEVAKWLGQTTDAVAKAEQGNRRFSVADLVRIAMEFSTPIDALVFGDEPRPTIMKVLKFDGSSVDSRKRR